MNTACDAAVRLREDWDSSAHGGDGDLERAVPLNTAPLNGRPGPLLCVHVLACLEFGLDLRGD